MSIPTLSYQYMPSPFGQLEIAATDEKLCIVRFKSECSHPTRNNEVLEKTIRQLTEYFLGYRHTFDLPLATDGTPFQQEVWRQLNRIPYGATCSYGEIASSIHRPKAVRAVGAANGRNRMSIIVPCHRVIGANGSLTGYAWGTSIKASLLAHEQKYKIIQS
ncbi:MAG: methylated-DNA--[protein]-cysteine S-methyltransferase [Paraglaciecola sp.]|nr:methylated-DNA--[protein]-cysteine S-methyltransferase [Paraglaciecola sp.]MDP5130446.1 methylated-DNA--[protein]-cysteine S-methyltransferase [Paraglaciecola sp.]